MSALLLLLISLFHPTEVRNCGRFPEADIRKSGRAFHRTYTNHAFGYRVRLPRTVTAHGERPPQPAHGVGIILSWEPRSYLYLDGSGNGLLLANNAAIADLTERVVRGDSTAVVGVTRNSSWLGKHKALRIRVVHKCGWETFVTDEILLLKRDIIYTISLTTPEARYEADKMILETIARSFRLIRLR